MSWRHPLTIFFKASSISWFDLAALLILFVGGFIYLHNCTYWGNSWVGDTQYGDAQFWWDGAQHIAQGIFQDNPGKGFRPGYFIFTGLTLPVLGDQFKQYYTYFLLTFLMTVGFFYSALRYSLGRWVGVCVAGMLVFNPYTAEWLATSTSDGTGLILHLAALSCLLLGVNKALHIRWLIAFGVLFSLATLTRPLVTPFIIITLLTLLLLPPEPVKKRLIIAIQVFIAFCLPILLWMAVQKLTINQWSISANDASAFYAASDPAIQVWNPPMYDHIQQLASNRYHLPLSKIDDRMMNSTFWQETLSNYYRYPKYHLRRILPTLLKIAQFNPNMATRGTVFWQIMLFNIITGGIFLWLFFQRQWLRAIVFIGLGVSICLSPLNMMAFMTFAGAILALIISRNQWKNQSGIFLLSTYWFTGVIAIYLTGGTNGLPETPTYALNPLGYRLGSQFFFIGNLLAAYFLIWLANFKFNLGTQTNLISSNLYRCCQFIFYKPIPLAGKLVSGCINIFLVLIIIIYLTGFGITMHRVYIRNYLPEKLYPQLEPIINMYRQKTGLSLIKAVGVKGGLDLSVFSQTSVKTGKADVIFIGSASSFIWNIPDQQRAQLLIHTQNQIRPYTMGPNYTIFDVPQHIHPKDWSRVQGAFITRQISDNHNQSNLPYYLTTFPILAFIPLSQDEKSFALKQAIWFPFVKNATQLETDGELRCLNAKITWSQNSGPAPFQRRFFITPSSDKALLKLNIGTAYKSPTLSFAYSMGDIPGAARKASQGNYDIKIFSLDKTTEARHEILSNSESIPPAGTDAPLKKVELHLSKNTQAVEIFFNNIPSGTGIWIYEFNLRNS